MKRQSKKSSASNAIGVNATVTITKAKKKQSLTSAGSKADKRYRVQHRFWLDLKTELGDFLDEKVRELKRKRKFQSTVIQALRLFFDLQSGRTDVLRELFPHVVEVLSGGTASREFEAIIQRLDALNNAHPVMVTPRKVETIVFDNNLYAPLGQQSVPVSDTNNGANLLSSLFDMEDF